MITRYWSVLLLLVGGVPSVVSMSLLLNASLLPPMRCIGLIGAGAIVLLVLIIPRTWAGVTVTLNYSIPWRMWWFRAL